MKSRTLQEESVDLRDPAEKRPVDTKWHSIWRGTNGVMMVFFGLAAAVNVNDWDWFLWVPIYLVPAVLSLAVVVKPTFSETNVWKYTASLHFLLCLVYAIVLTISVIEIIFGKEVNPLIHEEGREFAGLLIVMAWLAVCRFTPFGRSTSTTGLTNALLLITAMLSLSPIFLWSLCLVEGWDKKFGHCIGMMPQKEL